MGFFTSPNFPHQYAMHNEVFTYLLENEDPKGLVRLGFDDWNLSPNSRLTVSTVLPLVIQNILVANITSYNVQKNPDDEYINIKKEMELLL